MSAGGILVFADLDDTLFQTLRKLPNADPATLRAATHSISGVPHSFSTPAQVALLEWLARPAVTLIPVTGRNSAAMNRVLLPFGSWAVLDHGLTIWEAGGGVHQPWAAKVIQQLQPLQAQLDALHEGVRPVAKALGCRLTRHYAHGVPFMSVVKMVNSAAHAEATDAEALRAVQTWWTDQLAPNSELQVIANANNVSLLPKHLGKLEAVQYLKTLLPPAKLTLGLGDSISDLPFMGACDFALTPTAGQLFRTVQAAEWLQE